MRILIIEDEVKVSAFVRQALEEEGYAVDTVPDGESGLDLLRRAEYDLIILDWLLPGCDGLFVCRAIRSRPLLTPILMLTARDLVTYRIDGLDAGADDYLTKPFALGELLARVRALLRRGVSQPPELTIGDLRLNAAAHKVFRGEKEIALSAKEYALLYYLLCSRGRIVTRSMIAEHVWDYDFDSGTNVVDVYINYLRNKIDRGSEPKLIHTVRGVGYRLEDLSEPNVR